MFADTTPDKLNTMLKGSSFRDSAFAGSTKNLINWTKLEKYTGGLIKFHWRGRGYNGDKIKKAVRDHGACLVEVDFYGTGPKQDKHWVLYVGDKKLLDPWTGNEAPSNKYPHWTGWAEIEVNREADMPDDALQTCLNDRKKFWEERDAARADLEKCNQDKDKKDKRIHELEVELDDIKRQNVVLKEALENYKCPECPEEDKEPKLVLSTREEEFVEDGRKITLNYVIK